MIFFEKILEEFNEPHYGNIRVNIEIGKIKLDTLFVEEKIKFYFWINVFGICAMPKFKTNVFNEYNFVYSSPVNGIKLMNDEKEMLKLILPKINNQGDQMERERIELAELKEQERLAQEQKEEE